MHTVFYSLLISLIDGRFIISFLDCARTLANTMLGYFNENEVDLRCVTMKIPWIFTCAFGLSVCIGYRRCTNSTKVDGRVVGKAVHWKRFISHSTGWFFYSIDADHTSILSKITIFSIEKKICIYLHHRCVHSLDAARKYWIFQLRIQTIWLPFNLLYLLLNEFIFTFAYTQKGPTHFQLLHILCTEISSIVVPGTISFICRKYICPSHRIGPFHPPP